MNARKVTKDDVVQAGVEMLVARQELMDKISRRQGRSLVVHPLDGGDICFSQDGGDPRPWKDAMQPENGTIVTCYQCGRLGVEPHAGHSMKFIPRTGAS